MHTIQFKSLQCPQPLNLSAWQSPRTELQAFSSRRSLLVESTSLCQECLTLGGLASTWAETLDLQCSAGRLECDRPLVLLTLGRLLLADSPATLVLGEV